MRGMCVLCAVCLTLAACRSSADSAADAPAADVSAADVSAADVPAADVPAADVPAADVPAADVPAADVSATDAPATDAAYSDDAYGFTEQNPVGDISAHGADGGLALGDDDYSLIEPRSDNQRIDRADDSVSDPADDDSAADDYVPITDEPQSADALIDFGLSGITVDVWDGSVPFVVWTDPDRGSEGVVLKINSDAYIAPSSVVPGAVVDVMVNIWNVGTEDSEDLTVIADGEHINVYALYGNDSIDKKVPFTNIPAQEEVALLVPHTIGSGEFSVTVIGNGYELTASAVYDLQ